MTDELIRSVLTVAMAIVGLAILAVLVSRNANTSGVIESAGSAFSSSLLAAEAPVTGGTFSFGGGVSLPSLM